MEQDEEQILVFLTGCALMGAISLERDPVKAAQRAVDAARAAANLLKKENDETLDF